MELIARFLLVMVVAVVAGTGSASPGDELKAALVLGIARFAEWPPSARADAPIRIGVVGRSEFIPVLDRITAGRTAAGGRRLEVKAVKNSGDAEGCQILYFASVPPRETKTMLDAVRDGAVIAIGDSERFLDAGGAVYLFEEDGKIAFEVRLDALGRSGVTISAKLLKLGHIVRPRGSRQ